MNCNADFVERDKLVTLCLVITVFASGSQLVADLSRPDLPSIMQSQHRLSERLHFKKTSSTLSSARNHRH